MGYTRTAPTQTYTYGRQCSLAVNIGREMFFSHKHQDGDRHSGLFPGLFV